MKTISKGNIYNFLSLTFLILFSLNLCGQEICNNGIDDDGDDLIDLNDDECKCNNEVALAHVNGTLCTRLDLELGVSGATSYQWYRDGIAVSGENEDRLSLSRWMPEVEGLYQVYAETPGGCLTSEPYYAEMIEYHTDLGEISLCRGDTILVANTYCYKEGDNRIKTTAVDGCDSTIRFIIKFIDPTSERFRMTLCKGTTFTSPGGTIVTADSGSYEELHKTESDCDSVLTTYILEFVPNETYLDETICAGDTLFFMDIIATQSGSFESVAFDDDGCENNYFINLSVEDCTSTVREQEQPVTRIYPNPVSKAQELTIETAAPASFTIFDKVGRTVGTLDLKSGQNSISISTLQEGLYYCLIEGSDFKDSFKLIVKE